MLSRAVRRLVLMPLWLAITALFVLLSPLLLVIAVVTSLLVGRRQPLLILKFALVYLLREAAVIIACGALWVASGFGRYLRSDRFQLAHYGLMRWFLGGILDEIARTLRLTLETARSEPAERALRARSRPLLLFSRHAGPADSFLIVYLLLARYGRLPRIVMKEGLALDPCIDLMTDRLPNALIDPADQDRCEAQIAALARGMDERGILVLFPEGGNFTSQRRRLAIDRLRRRGRRSRAARAEQMPHLMPPKPGGAFAALAANPHADVIFTVHTGLGRATFLGDLWQQVPTDQTLHMRMWFDPAAGRPTDRDEQIDWLYGWWKRMDDWIDAQGTEPVDEVDRPAHR